MIIPAQYDALDCKLIELLDFSYTNEHKSNKQKMKSKFEYMLTTDAFKTINTINSDKSRVFFILLLMNFNLTNCAIFETNLSHSIKLLLLQDLYMMLP